MAKRKKAKRRRRGSSWPKTTREFPPGQVLHERYPGESLVRWEAFELYRDMGRNRSHAAVGRALGKTTGVINRWGKQDRWALRVESWEAYKASTAAKMLRKQQDEYFARQIRMGRKLENAALKIIAEKFGKNLEKITPDSMKAGDLLRLIEIAFKLQREISVGKTSVVIGGDDADGGIETIEGQTVVVNEPAKLPLESAIPFTHAERMGEALQLFERARARAAAEIAGVETTEEVLPPSSPP